MIFPCEPRLNWQNCPAEWLDVFQKFHQIALSVHLLHLPFFICAFLLDYYHRKSREKLTYRQYFGLLTTKFNVGVIVYMLMISCHHLALITKEPLLPVAITELLYNFYNIGIFVTLMLLVRHWAILPLSIDSNIKDYSQKARLAFYCVTLLIASSILISDLIMFLDNSSIQVNITVQYLIWGICCLLNGILYGIFGYRLIKSVNAVSSHQVTGNNQRKILLKIKLIYYVYIIISGPYAALYFIIVGFQQQYLVWLVVHSFFNLAGPLTGWIIYILDITG